MLYGDYNGIIDINTCEMIEGDLPKRALKMAQEWTQQQQQSLLSIWETQQFTQLPPLE